MSALAVIRANVATDIDRYAFALKRMERAHADLTQAAGDVAKHDERMHAALQKDAPELEALTVLLDGQRTRLKHKLYAMCEQLGRLLARDVLAPIARESSEPVVFVTSNAYVPPLRDLVHADAIWSLETGDETTNATAYECFAQAIDDELQTLRVLLEAPEDDNALYVVDLARFEHAPDAEGDSLNDEWRPLGQDG